MNGGNGYLTLWPIDQAVGNICKISRSTEPAPSYALAYEHYPRTGTVWQRSTSRKDWEGVPNGIQASFAGDPVVYAQTFKGFLTTENENEVFLVMAAGRHGLWPMVRRIRGATDVPVSAYPGRCRSFTEFVDQRSRIREQIWRAGGDLVQTPKYADLLSAQREPLIAAAHARDLETVGRHWGHILTHFSVPSDLYRTAQDVFEAAKRKGLDGVIAQAFCSLVEEIRPRRDPSQISASSRKA